MLKFFKDALIYNNVFGPYRLIIFEIWLEGIVISRNLATAYFYFTYIQITLLYIHIKELLQSSHLYGSAYFLGRKFSFGFLLTAGNMDSHFFPGVHYIRSLDSQLVVFLVEWWAVLKI